MPTASPISDAVNTGAGSAMNASRKVHVGGPFVPSSHILTLDRHRDIPRVRKLVAVRKTTKYPEMHDHDVTATHGVHGRQRENEDRRGDWTPERRVGHGENP